MSKKPRLVLAGFLGAGARNSGRYDLTRYRFPDQTGIADENIEATELFPLALQQYLIRQNRHLNLWLIMGTTGTAWSELENAVPSEQIKSAEFVDLRNRVAEKFSLPEDDKNAIDQSLLSDWGRVLSDLTGLDVRCWLTNAGQTSDEQHGIWEALQQNINDRDELYFDITYGFRHQPVVASFSIMLLRLLKDLGPINICYGSFDPNKPQEAQPAIFLPFCEQLTRSCEAFARYKFSGDYRGLGEELQLGENFNAHLKKVAYDDEVNRPNRLEAQALRGVIDQPLTVVPPHARSFIDKVKEALDWVSHTRLDRQYERKAERAFACEQYFQAVAYLYEAIVLADCYAHLRGKDFMSYYARARRTYKNKNAKPLSDLELALGEEQLATFRKITYIRNGVLHGTLSEDKDIGKEVEAIIADRDSLSAMFQAGRKLFRELSFPTKNS